MSRLLIPSLVVLIGFASASAGDCVTKCKSEFSTCVAEAVADVRACQDDVREACAAACDCEDTEGAARVACYQRCEVCKDMERQLAGRDCDALDDERRDECDDELEDCKSSCGE